MNRECKICQWQGHQDELMDKNRTTSLINPIFCPNCGGNEIKEVQPPKAGDTVLVFNNPEWPKTGDLPGGNEPYWQSATIVKIRSRKASGELLADVKFNKSGKVSNGHFVHGIRVSN